MANTNIANGFTPVMMADGKPYYGIGKKYYKDSAVANMVIAVGDPVIRVTASSDPLGGPSITRATTGSEVTGIVVGIEPVRTNLAQVGYLGTGDSGYVYVEDDPYVIYEVQEGNSTGAAGTPLTIANAVGQCINSCTAVAGNTTIGRSKYNIDNSALGTSTYTWIIKGLVQRSDNAVGSYAKWLVQANKSTEINAAAANIEQI